MTDHPTTTRRHAVPHVILQYFDGCPNWRTADRRLAELADDHDPSATTGLHVPTACCVSTAQGAPPAPYGPSGWTGAHHYTPYVLSPLPCAARRAGCHALLAIAVLGTPQLRHGGVPLSFGTAKATALLCYLAITGDRQPRTGVAELLWPHLRPDRARGNLRVVLHELRRELGSHLNTDSRTVTLAADRPLRVDLRELEAAAAASPSARADLQRTTAMWRGSLCDGVRVRDSAPFELWLQAEQERTRRLLLDALRSLSQAELRDGCPDAAIATTRRILAIDPLDEGAHRELMALLDATGRRGAALAQFETSRAVLREELGVDPSRATVELRDRLLRADADAPSSGALPHVEGVRRSSPLRTPAPALTSFVGREEELGRLETLVTDGAARLVTLVGPGGVGKTRLARAALERVAPAFADGAAFVALTGIPVQTPDPAELTAATIADVLGLAPRVERSRRQDLIEQLRERDLLLVLDNVDQLELTAFVDTLLAGAPGVVVLATSRRRLGSGAEWLLDLAGLPVPGPDATDLRSSPAARLFLDRAAMVRPDVTPSDAMVAVICRSVAGLPLAIELAAQLMRTLDAADIVHGLARDLDLLQTDAAGFAPRHRSLRAVLTSSWAELHPAEQDTLAQLSVFQGGFDAAAAVAVTTQPVSVLTTLVDRSLVMRDGRRFQLHELLGEFAREQLTRRGSTDAVLRHARHFAERLAQAAPALADRSDADVVERLTPELANLRLAARQLARHSDEGELAGFVDALWLLYERRHLFRDATELLSLVLLRPTINPALRTRWHRLAASAHYELGALDEARGSLLRAAEAAGHRLPSGRTLLRTTAALHGARQLRHQLRASRPPATDTDCDPLTSELVKTFVQLAALDHTRRRPETSFLAAPLTANAADRSGGASERALAHAGMAIVTDMLRLRRVSDRYVRSVIVTVPAARDPLAATLALLTVGNVLVSEGRWDDAYSLLERAVSLATRAGHPRRVEETLGLLSVVDQWRGDFPTAIARFERMLVSAEQRGETRQVLSALTGTAQTRLRIDPDPSHALELYQQAATLGERFPVLAGLARSHQLVGDLGEARALARAALTRAGARTRPTTYLGESYHQLAETWLALLGTVGPAADRDVEVAAAEAVRLLDRFARQHPVAVPRARWATARLMELRGDRRGAERRLVATLEAAERLGLPYEQARAHLDLARLLEGTGRDRAGWTSAAHLQRAHGLFTALGTVEAAGTGTVATGR